MGGKILPRQEGIPQRYAEIGMRVRRRMGGGQVKKLKPTFDCLTWGEKREKYGWLNSRTQLLGTEGSEGFIQWGAGSI